MQEDSAGVITQDKLNILYRLMQYWAWENITTDSVLLRVEVGQDSAGNDDESEWSPPDLETSLYNSQLVPLNIDSFDPSTLGMLHRSASTQPAGVYTSSLLTDPNGGLYDTSLDKVYFVPIRTRDSFRGLCQ